MESGHVLSNCYITAPHDFCFSRCLFRELQHDNLCKFLGAIILKDRRWPEDRVALVMEKYPENLRSVIFNDDYVPPASAVDASSPSVVRFLHWASQLANALAYIHDMKFIHKHLKLENMLVSNNILALKRLGQSQCIAFVFVVSRR